MNAATWSIRNPIPAILLFIVLTLAGAWGFHALPIQNLPDLDLPTVIVSIRQPGAAPAQLETEVARKVEDSLASVAGLRHIRTSVTDGQVTISAEFALETPLSDALLDTKNAVDRVRSDLPQDVLPPSVVADPFGSAPSVVYALASTTMSEEQLSRYVDDTVSRTIGALPGVGRFARVGGIGREVLVEVDPVRLAALGASVEDVSRAVRRVQQQASGGQARLGGARQSLRIAVPVAEAARLLGALTVVLADGRAVRLDQIARIVDGDAQRTQAAMLDGRPAVGFNVYRARGHDETAVAAATARAVAALQAADPTVRFTPVAGSVGYTQEQYRGSMEMLYGGAILTVLVVWMFLRDWRATAIAATALPLSILPPFAVMAWLGYSLNTITLLALTVVVGILVDDAIVEIENIERHRRMGKPIRQATAEAVSEIALAVTATTLSLVAVFLPTALMTGVPGLLFKEFGWTAVLAVLTSLLVARLLTPLMAIHFLKPGHDPEGTETRLMASYLGLVRWCLSHRRTTLAATLGFAAASLALVPLIPTGFLPAADRGTSTVSIELPPGTDIAATRQVAEDARRALRPVRGIARVFTVVGSADEADARRATLTLALAPRGERAAQARIEAEVRTRLAGVPGARFTVSGGGPGGELEIVLASGDTRALEAGALALERAMRGIAGLANVRSTASLERPEIVVTPDPVRAAEQGLTTQQIAAFARIATSGDFDTDTAKLDLDSRQVPIRVRAPLAVQTDLDALGALRIVGRGGPVPLASVATLALGSGPSSVERYDRQRYVTITADLGDMPLGRARAAVAALPQAHAPPPGVALIEVGDSELASDLASGFAMALVVGVLAVYCVLTLLFRDFFQPLTILSAIPLSAGGAFVALLAGRSELDIPALIGLTMLTGIVTKNSILLVEYAVVGMAQRGLAMGEALVEACHKRARPIVMTTVAMIAGMAPVALGLGADASFYQPMAIAVIGGLLTSTALSLLVVPVAFTYVAGLERRVRRWVKLPGEPALVAADWQAGDIAAIRPAP
jgi:multidrug efflux pump subunit AcrB